MHEGLNGVVSHDFFFLTLSCFPEPENAVKPDSISSWEER